MAKGFGVKGIKIKTLDELKAGLKEAVAYPGPVVLDVAIHPDTYSFPMVPPGKESTAMIFDADEWEG